MDEQVAVRSRPHILIVDDLRAYRLQFSSLLRQHGFRTFDACSGNVALSLVHERCFDAVVTDLQMPDGSGEELIHGIRNSTVPSIRRLPVIVVSASADEQARLSVIEAGASGFLTKPVESEALVAGLNELV